MSLDTSKLDPFIRAIADNWPGDWTIAPGISPTCPDCQSDQSYSPREFFSRYESGEIADEGSFSWQSCDSCGSSLGGDRYAAHAVHRKHHEVIHLAICQDCVLFHANGDEPENWEFKIEYMTENSHEK